MKKIALCLFGYFSNREDSNAGIKGYQYIKDNILKYPNVDVFIHSWDMDNSGKILELYNPKKCTFEKQVDFEKLANKKGVFQKDIDKGFDRQHTIYHQCTIQASLSFFSSRALAILMKSSYEMSEGFEYDAVITARFDLGHRSKMHRGYNVSLIDFNPDYDMQYIYCALFSQLNNGLPDQWFYSNSKNINLLIPMQEHCLEDFKIQSEYNQALNNGWFDSNADDEFSNEMLKPEENRSINLIKYPQWDIINNHHYHKYYFKKVGLYNHLKFVIG